jgi:hypothetical protein
MALKEFLLYLCQIGMFHTLQKCVSIEASKGASC